MKNFRVMSFRRFWSWAGNFCINNKWIYFTKQISVCANNFFIWIAFKMNFSLSLFFKSWHLKRISDTADPPGINLFLVRNKGLALHGIASIESNPQFNSPKQSKKLSNPNGGNQFPLCSITKTLYPSNTHCFLNTARCIGRRRAHLMDLYLRHVNKAEVQSRCQMAQRLACFTRLSMSCFIPCVSPESDGTLWRAAGVWCTRRRDIDVNLLADRVNDEEMQEKEKITGLAINFYCTWLRSEIQIV